jgi:hypothetical protein
VLCVTWLMVWYVMAGGCVGTVWRVVWCGMSWWIIVLRYVGRGRMRGMTRWKIASCSVWLVSLLEIVSCWKWLDRWCGMSYWEFVYSVS